MAKIKSPTTVILNAEEQISGTILIELNSPIHDVLSKEIRCNINHFHQEESRLLSSKTWVLPDDKAAVLLQACVADSENIDSLLAGFLLEKFQSHSAYGVLPNEWEISGEIISQRPSE